MQLFYKTKQYFTDFYRRALRSKLIVVSPIRLSGVPPLASLVEGSGVMPHGSLAVDFEPVGVNVVEGDGLA